MSKLVLAIIAVVVVVGLGWYALSQRAQQPSGTDAANQVSMNATQAASNQIATDSPTKDPVTASVKAFEQSSQGVLTQGIREFNMDSYYDMENKRAVFTLGELVVRKGERVRVNVRNTFGKHDFVIDELGVSVETPQDQTTVVEFTADKAGEFIYYCSKPNHRASGQWGIIKVLE